MDKIVRNKWQVRVAALAVFLLGFTAGALALNAYRSWARDDSIVRAPRHKNFERMLERLDLTSEQEAQVRQILSDTRKQVRAMHKESEPRFEEVRRQTDERLRAVLNAEQWERFQQMKEEMRARKAGKRRGPPPVEER